MLILIVTVTLNAAVDKTYTVENFTLDRVHRPSDQRSVAGGKGINVARVLHTLGQPVIASGFIGGYNGGLIESSLKNEGIPYDFIKVNGESRLCIAIVDSTRRTQTEVNENGPHVSSEEVEVMYTKIESLIKGASYLILSGSAPPGVPDDFYARVITTAKAAGVYVVLDSSGEHLRSGLKAHPDMVKPNVAELSAYVGSELYTMEEILKAAKKLVNMGVRLAVVSMGRAGALATNGKVSWQAVPPDIDFVSAVGSGDSLVAAFVDTLARGGDIPKALAAGTAAGAANATIYGAGYCDVESIEKIKSQVNLFRLP
ncbi:MAG: 1-phosphofructokinase [Armatimonadota bacterium]